MHAYCKLINHGGHTHKDVFLVHPVDTLTYFRSWILLYKVLRFQYFKGKYIYYAEGGDEDVKGGHRNIFWH